MRALSRPRELYVCEEEMAANPILGRSVTHSGAGVLPGLPVLNVTSVGIPWHFGTGAGTAANHSTWCWGVSECSESSCGSYKHLSPTASLSQFLSLSLSLSTFCVLTVLLCT